jgi:hypothetical protein
MKKITFVLAGLMFSGVASAVQLESSGPVTIADCALLNEDVRINLSAGVFAGVSCTPTVIALSACHSAGKVTSRTVPVRLVPESGEAPNIIPAHLESCIVDSDGCVVTPVTGAAMPTATTALGTVNTQYPGALCAAGAAEANSTVMMQ